MIGAPSNYPFPFRTGSSKAVAGTIVVPRGTAKIPHRRGNFLSKKLPRGQGSAEGRFLSLGFLVFKTNFSFL